MQWVLTPLLDPDGALKCGYIWLACQHNCTSSSPRRKRAPFLACAFFAWLLVSTSRFFKVLICEGEWTVRRGHAMRSAVSRYPREAFVPVFEAEVTLRFVAETRQIQKDKNARFSALCPPFLIALGISPISDFFSGPIFHWPRREIPSAGGHKCLNHYCPCSTNTSLSLFGLWFFRSKYVWIFDDINVFIINVGMVPKILICSPLLSHSKKSILYLLPTQ